MLFPPHNFFHICPSPFPTFKKPLYCHSSVNTLSSLTFPTNSTILCKSHTHDLRTRLKTNNTHNAFICLKFFKLCLLKDIKLFCQWSFNHPSLVYLSHSMIRGRKSENRKLAMALIISTFLQWIVGKHGGVPAVSLKL